MSADRVVDFIALGIVGLELVLPLATGLPVILAKDPGGKPRLSPRALRRSRKDRSGGDDGAAPRRALAPLTCSQCRAPVPLIGRAAPCPHCGAAVTPPPEYVAAFEDRARAEEMLARAERVWIWSRVTSSRWLLWPANLLIVLSLPLVVGAGIVAEDAFDLFPHAAMWLASILAIVQVFGGLAFTSVLGDMRKGLPRVPRAAFRKLDAGDGPCQGCGSPVHFDVDRYSATCPYCTAETYREALAAAARKDAAAGAARARVSLTDAVASRDERKRELVLLFGFMAIAEIFYAVIFTLVVIGNFIGL